MKFATFRTTIAVALGIFLSSAGASAQESIEYYATDAVGSVRVVFDSIGAVESRMDYEPFGEPVFQPTVKPKEQFAGWLHDEETDLGYAKARQYQSHTGRFTTVDPMFSASEPQSWNRYSYGLNSPLVFVDPAGADPISVTSVPGCDTFICDWDAERQFWGGFFSPPVYGEIPFVTHSDLAAARANAYRAAHLSTSTGGSGGGDTGGTDDGGGDGGDPGDSGGPGHIVALRPFRAAFLLPIGPALKTVSSGKYSSAMTSQPFPTC